jgi:hypothetical protein
MTADRIVDILLDAVDPKFMTNIVRGSFSVKLSGVPNEWTGASCCDAILYGDGRLKLLNENQDVVFKTKHFYIIERESGYYGSTRPSKSFRINFLQHLYPVLAGQVIWLNATTSDPKMKGRNHVDYMGVVQKR